MSDVEVRPAAGIHPMPLYYRTHSLCHVIERDGKICQRSELAENMTANYNQIHERKAMFCPKWYCSRDKIIVPVEKNIDRAIK